MTAAAKRTLASPPARLRWRHGTARTRHDGHRVETPQGHAPHGRVKRSRQRLPLCSVQGPAGKRQGFPRHRHQPRIFARASAMLRISARASRTTSRRTPRSNHRRGGSSGIRSTSQASPLGQDMLNTIADQIHFHRRKTCAPVQDASSTTGRFSSSSSSQQG